MEKINEAKGLLSENINESYKPLRKPGKRDSTDVLSV